MKTTKILLAGVAINFVSFLVGGGSYFLFGGVFNLEPRAIWKWTPAQGFNMPAKWWVILFLLNLVLAIAFAFIYALIEKGLPGQGLKKGLSFGLIVWIVGPIPALITMYLMINIATGALIYFTLQSLVEWLIYGAVISAIYREKFCVTKSAMI